MELLERYLQAISTFLPSKNANDILRELRENMLSQVDEREASLGRALTIEEQENLIRQHGHPILVAARYGPHRQLIGQTLFPFYWLTLRVSLLIAFAIRGLMVLMTIVVSSGGAVRLFAGLPSLLLTVFAIVTLGFAGLEYLFSIHTISSKATWQPSKLPALRGEWRTVPRAKSATGFIAGMAGAIWWQAIPSSPVLLFGPAALFVQPGPNWQLFQYPILALLVLGAVFSLVDLLRPHVSKARDWIDLAFSAPQAILFGLILQAGNWVVVRPGLQDHAKGINQVIFYCLLGALATALFEFARKCYLFYHQSRMNAAGLAASHFA